MNKLIFAVAVTFALIACANIPVIAEQGNIATVKPGGSIPTILWWKLGKPIRTGDGGFGVEVFVPNYLREKTL